MSYSSSGSGSGSGSTSMSSAGSTGSSSGVDYYSTVDNESADAEGVVLFLSVAILIGCVCRWLVKRFDRLPLPFTVLLLFVGVVMGALVGYDHRADNAFQAAILVFSNLPPHLALYLFLPVLIFDSAFNVHFHLFMHSLWASLLLAFPGAVLALFAAALVPYYCFDYGWSFTECLLLGSILAATDPVAVVSLMRDLGASYALSALVEAESLLNDGSAYVVYLVVESVLLNGTTSAGSVVGSLFQYSLGGPAFGVLVGVVTVAVMDAFIYSDTEIEIAITIAVVYVAFYVADSVLDISAVLALVCLGLVMSKNRYSISPSVQPSLHAVWSSLVFIANILIFLLIGLIIADKLFFTQGVGWRDVGCVVLLYVVLHVARFLSIVAFLPLFNRSSLHLSWSEVLMISWSGVRGGMSLLLALTAYLQPALDPDFRSRLTFLVCGVSLLTLVINCVTAKYLLKWLKLDRGTEESSLVLQSALLHMREETEEVMEKLANKARFKRVDWEAIESYLPKQLIDEVLEETGQPPLPNSPPPNSPLPGDESDAMDGTHTPTAADADVVVDMPTYYPNYYMTNRSPLTTYRSGRADHKEALQITRMDTHDEQDGESDSQSDSLEDSDSEQDGDEEHPTTTTSTQASRSRALSRNAPFHSEAQDDRQVEMATQATVTDSNNPSLLQGLTPSSSQMSLATVASCTLRTTPLDPPPGPSAPVAPHPPPFLTVPHSQVWADLPFRLPRRSNHSRRPWRSNTNSVHLRIVPPVPRGRMLRELSVRYLTAMQADYTRQFSSGLITRSALRALNVACEHGVSMSSVSSCWEMIRQRMNSPRWLSYAYSSPYLLSDDWYVRPLVPFVHRLLFGHLKLCIELATAFLGANRRLEAVLKEFPEVSLIDTSVVSAVQQQVAALQHQAIEQWLSISTGYGEAHSAVVTRHAAIMLLHFQQREIRSLHSTGMLEQREFDLIVALINAKLVRLDQRGLSMHMSAAADILQQHPLVMTLTAEQKRTLRTLMRAKHSRRVHGTHQTVWERGQRCPGLILTVRGTYRVQYDYEVDGNEDADGEEDTGKHGEQGGYQRDGERAGHKMHQGQSHLRLLDTKGRLGIIGAYELLTGHSTLAGCRSVTMAESFVLDSECVAVLLDEDEAMQMLARSAAEDIVKAKWSQWYGGGSAGSGGTKGAGGSSGESDMKQYHVAELMKRAHVFRSRPAAGSAAGGSAAPVVTGPGDSATCTDGAGREDEAGRGEVEMQQQHQRDANVSTSQRNKVEGKEEEAAAQEAVSGESATRNGTCAPTSAAATSFHTPSATPSSSSSSQHRITLRYSDVLLIIDGSAVGSGMTRRVRRSRAQMKQQQQLAQQSRLIQQLQQQPHPSTMSLPVPVPAPAFADPLVRPVPVSSPLYLGPCMLRGRSGTLLMSANCLYARWELRDEEIASLHPPPPRADMRQYARELGLQLKLSAAQNAGGQKGLDKLGNRSPLHNRPPFVSAASFQQRSGAPSTSQSSLHPAVAATTVTGGSGSSASGGGLALSSFSTLPLTRLPSSSATFASSAGASGGSALTAAPQLQRPTPLSELPSPRLAQYLGAADWRNTTEPHSAAAQQQQQQQQLHNMQHQQRRHSLDLSAELLLRDQHKQRRAQTASPEEHNLHNEQHDAAGVQGEDEDDMVEVEEIEAQWQPSNLATATHAQHSKPAINRQLTRAVFAFDIEGNNALTI